VIATATATLTQEQLDGLCINTIRTLSIDAVEKATCGHPGMPMGAAAMAYVLWTRYLRHNPADPAWPGRDRFVLSAGHGSMLLYSLLHLTGYDLSLDELKNFRQLGSRTPGHPEHGLTPGVEATTGPLGQGFGMGVGMAIAAEHLAARFNRPGFDLVPARIYAIVSDGDLMEGVAAEAASLAGHLRLGRLIYLYDDNLVSLDGPTDLSYTDDAVRRFDAYGWHTQRVADGNDLQAVARAIEAAQRDVRPSLIAVRTHIGFGSPNRQDSSEAHGKALGPEETRLTKQAYGWPLEPTFLVPEEARAHFRQCLDRGARLQDEWETTLRRYAERYPQEARAFRDALAGRLPDGWEQAVPAFGAADAQATRSAFGKAMNAVAAVAPTLLGGSADLSGSNDTTIRGSKPFSREERAGRNLYYGVREHAMGAAMNGIALFGGVRPFGGTFLTFSDYMRGSVRLAALQALPVIYVWTHDSIGLGEDGPTHQPVEHLSALRAVPHLLVLRPADANETAGAWVAALRHSRGPSALVLSRQKLPVITPAETAVENVARGGYVLLDAPGGTPELILLGTGSELQLALEAGKRLQTAGRRVRVVSMPSFELFKAQPKEYRDAVLPGSCRRRLAVEAASAQSWWEFVGLDGGVISMEGFGASAPAEQLFPHFGFTPENVVERARALLD
jgi:transketolase